MNGKFRVNDYELNAQRFIYPLYMKDGNGGYHFSSTMTFVKFDNQHFCVFAAHALPKDVDDLNQIGMLTTDGKFMPFSDIEVSHEICRIRDLVVCHTIGAFEYKHYFDMGDNKSTTEISENFGWIGFPKKKAIQVIHNSKATSEKIKEHLTEGVEGLQKWTNANFLLIGMKQVSETESEITGFHDNENVQYTHEGFKQKGYSLKGMSGGALFRGPIKIRTESPSLNDFFDFVGIGLEYENNLVKGASKSSVLELIKKTLKLS
ncbi:hypothetical protein HCH73_19845 [Citrobacter koseri]|uniref:hypothetical protein n=1 Tax=Citrobacter koseri TaxID=545 RepID=UPI0018E189DA|nr:hypothetical protein [Citrobacter koseri]MBI0679280.1 hypothetical protein [Citrobacter koseri]